MTLFLFYATYYIRLFDNFYVHDLYMIFNNKQNINKFSNYSYNKIYLKNYMNSKTQIIDRKYNNFMHVLMK